MTKELLAEIRALLIGAAALASGLWSIRARYRSEGKVSDTTMLVFLLALTFPATIGSLAALLAP